MKRVIYNLVLCITVIMCMLAGVHAAELTWDIKAPILEVDGTGFEAEERTTVVLYAPGFDGSNTNKDNFDKAVLFTAQMDTDLNGALQVDINLDGKEIKGWCTLQAKNEENDESRTFYYISAGGVVLVCKDFNSDTADLDALFTKYTDEAQEPVLTIELDAFYDANKETILTSVAALRDGLNDGEGFKTLGEIDDAYNTAVMLLKLKTATEEELPGLIEDYSELIGVQVNEFYNDNKTAIAKKFAELTADGVDDLSDVKTKYADALLICEFNVNDEISAMDELIAANAEKFDTTAEKYNSYTNPTLGSYLISKRPCDTIDDIKAEIANAISDHNTQNTNTTTTKPSKKPSNGGGGGFIATPQPEVKKAYFNDMDTAAWAQEAVNTLYEKGIIAGKGEGVFAPNDNVKREEFTKMIVEAFGVKLSAGISTFADVAEGAWYESYISAANESGIVNGISVDKFGVGADITRQDAAVIIYRAMIAMNYEFNSIRDGVTFTDDAQIADYAAEAVDAMYRAGIINGMGGGSFEPLGNCTRAQAAKMIYEVLK